MKLQKVFVRVRPFRMIRASVPGRDMFFTERREWVGYGANFVEVVELMLHAPFLHRNVVNPEDFPFRQWTFATHPDLL